jgi:predicted O-methyltransferase YrrM
VEKDWGDKVTTKTSEEWSEAFGFLYPGEVAGLKELARGLPPTPVVVNVGAGVGTSGLAFLESREDLLLFTVDIEGGISPTGGLGNERFAFEKADIDPDRYKQLRSDSINMAKVWSYGQVDLVFIDGEHSHEYVAVEGPLWYKHVKPGGVIAFHDYGAEFWGALVEAINAMALGEPILQVDTLVAFRKETS